MCFDIKVHLCRLQQYREHFVCFFPIFHVLIVKGTLPARICKLWSPLRGLLSYFIYWKTHAHVHVHSHCFRIGKAYSISSTGQCGATQLNTCGLHYLRWLVMLVTEDTHQHPWPATKTPHVTYLANRQMHKPHVHESSKGSFSRTNPKPRGTHLSPLSGTPTYKCKRQSHLHVGA